MRVSKCILYSVFAHIRLLSHFNACIKPILVCRLLLTPASRRSIVRTAAAAAARIIMERGTNCNSTACADLMTSFKRNFSLARHHHSHGDDRNEGRRRLSIKSNNTEIKAGMPGTSKTLINNPHRRLTTHPLVINDRLAAGSIVA